MKISVTRIKISSHKPGEKVALKVFRSGRTVDLDVTLGDREEGIRREFGIDAPDAHHEREEQPEKSSGLGLTVENLSDRTRERLSLEADQKGVVVTHVDFESQADDEGLRPTMVIVAVNDKPVTSVAEWERAVGKLEPGTMLLPYSRKNVEPATPLRI